MKNNKKIQKTLILNYFLFIRDKEDFDEDSFKSKLKGFIYNVLLQNLLVDERFEHLISQTQEQTETDQIKIFNTTIVFKFQFLYYNSIISNGLTIPPLLSIDRQSIKYSYPDQDYHTFTYEYKDTIGNEITFKLQIKSIMSLLDLYEFNTLLINSNRYGNLSFEITSSSNNCITEENIRKYYLDKKVPRDCDEKIFSELSKRIDTFIDEIKKYFVENYDKELSLYNVVDSIGNELKGDKAIADKINSLMTPS